jgi:hypothetical protein
MDMKFWDGAPDSFAALRSQGFRLAVADCGPDAISIHDVDWTIPTAVVMGNEFHGLSDAVRAAADIKVTIPMRGFVQSFNVSVAGALIMHTATRAILAAVRARVHVHACVRACVRVCVCVCVCVPLSSHLPDSFAQGYPGPTTEEAAAMRAEFYARVSLPSAPDVQEAEAWAPRILGACEHRESDPVIGERSR